MESHVAHPFAINLFIKHATAPPRTWGAAYHIPAEHVDEVKAYLDIREINGYSVDFAAFHVPVHVATARGSPNADFEKIIKAPAPIKCLVYIGMPNNPQFLGPQDPAELAAHIVKSKGPSGENKEYVYNLATALDQIRRDGGINVEVDEHVHDIASRVRNEEEKLNKTGAVGSS